MKKVKTLIALMLAGIITATAAGCGSGASKKPAETDNKKVLTFATTDAKAAIDMQKVTYSQVLNVADHIVETLITTNNDLKLEPVLLKQMPTLSEDGLTYSFELKPGVKFHNGETLKTSDVKFSLERLLKEGTMFTLIDTIKGADKVINKEAQTLEGFKAIDDTKFEITLNKPFIPFLAALATPYVAIYPEKACSEAGEDWGVKTLVGTGPYTFNEYTQGSRIVLEKNPNYHGNAPKIDELVFKFIDDPNTQVMEFEKGNVDILELESTLYTTYANDSKLKDLIHKFTPIGEVYMSPNNSLPEFQDARVKEALSYVIDRESIANDLLHGTADPAKTFLPPGLDGYKKDAKPYEYNPEKAKQLLADAGYKDGIELEIVVPARSQMLVKVATAIQDQAKPAGINFKVNQVDAAAWTDMKKKGTIPLCVTNWYVDYIDPDGMLYQVMSKDSARQRSNFYDSAEFNDLLEQARTINDSAKRAELYQKADELATRIDYSIIPIYNESKFYMSQAYVKDFAITSAYRIRFSNSDIDLAAKNAK